MGGLDFIPAGVGVQVIIVIKIVREMARVRLGFSVVLKGFK